MLVGGRKVDKISMMGTRWHGSAGMRTRWRGWRGNKEVDEGCAADSRAALLGRREADDEGFAAGWYDGCAAW